MPDLPIQNETDYALTAAILDQIKRDALEYFGESVRSIKVQYGIERHAFNAKTGEMRYAFSPGDFGLIDMKVSFPDVYHNRRDVRSIDDDEEAEVDEVAFDEVDVEEEEEEIGAPTFERFEEEIEEEEEEADFEAIEDDFEEIEDDDEDKEFLYDDDEYN